MENRKYPTKILTKSVYRPEELKKRWLPNWFENEYSQKRQPNLKMHKALE